jgi:DNA-directed RNA polymerase specialized sigma24 family protein
MSTDKAEHEGVTAPTETTTEAAGRTGPAESRVRVTGNAAAFKLLENPTLRTIVVQYCRRALPEPDKQDAEDLAHDVYVALVGFVRGDGQDATEDQLTALARGIMRNMLRDRAKRRRTERERSVGPTDQADEHACCTRPSPEDQFEIDEMLKQIDLGLGPANDRLKAAMYAIAMESTPGEHARDTGESPAAVRKMVERGRAMVRERYKQIGLAVAVAVLFCVLIPAGGLGPGAQQWAMHLFAPEKPFEYTPRDWSTPRPPEVTDQEIAKAHEAARKTGDEIMKAEVAFKREEWNACLEHARTAGLKDTDSLVQTCQTEEQNALEAKGPQLKPKPKRP